MASGNRIRRAWRRASGPRGRDVFVVVTAALFTAGQLVGRAVDVDGAGAETTAVWAMSTVLGAAAVAALWWRRRHPLVVTVVALCAAGVAAAYLPACFALMSLAVRRRDRVLVAATAVGAFALSAPEGWSYSWNLEQLAGGAAAALIFVLFGAYVGARRDLVASLVDRAQRAEQERELRGEQARIAERARIAREMHDVLAHKVSLIALHAGALEIRPDRPAAEVESTAGLIRSTARATLEDLRGVLGVLRSDDPDAPLAPQPTMEDLERLVQESRSAGVDVSLILPEPGGAPVAAATGRTVYRIVQEGLTNVHKHARGARTAVTVSRSGPPAPVLTVEVRNVRPVAAESLLPGSGAGLAGLHERVELAGGTLAAGPVPGGGWRLAAVIPDAPATDTAPATDAAKALTAEPVDRAVPASATVPGSAGR